MAYEQVYPAYSFGHSAQPCTFYGSARGCIRGSNCYYSHNNPLSIPLCRNYPNQCIYGNKCRFRHFEEHQPIETELCTFYNTPRGCQRGNQCRYKHIKQELPKQDETLYEYSMNELIEMKLNIPQRKWRQINTSADNDQKHSVSFCQFNCLAQSLCHGNYDRIAFKCNEKHLLWKHRCKRILYEILQYFTDIICLTEVDKVHFDSFYGPNLSKHGYDGMYLQKNTINYDSHVEVRDGLAMFWKMDKIIFLSETFECVLGAMNECFQNAMGGRFGLKEDKKCIFDVYNTHLKAGRSNESEAKRVKQCEILMNFIKEKSNRTPVILCGDLNLHFDELLNDENEIVYPTAYKYLTNGGLKKNENENDSKNESGDECGLKFDSVWNGNEYNRFSVYAGWMDRTVIACFDYIMISRWNGQKNEDIVVEEALNGFEKEQIEKYESRLPNEDYPSDHFLIAAKLRIGCKQSNEISNDNDGNTKEEKPIDDNEN